MRHWCSIFLSLLKNVKAKLVWGSLSWLASNVRKFGRLVIGSRQDYRTTYYLNTEIIAGLFFRTIFGAFKKYMSSIATFCGALRKFREARLLLRSSAEVPGSILASAEVCGIIFASAEVLRKLPEASLLLRRFCGGSAERLCGDSFKGKLGSAERFWGRFCGGSAEVLRRGSVAGGSAEVLRRFPGGSAEVPWRFCGGSAEVLRRFCREVLRRWF